MAQRYACPGLSLSLLPRWGPAIPKLTTAASCLSQARARTVLTMDDLSAALKEYGVQADRAAYYL